MILKLAVAVVVSSVLPGAVSAGAGFTASVEPSLSRVRTRSTEAPSSDAPPVVRPGSLPPGGRRGRFGLGPSSFALTSRLAAESDLHHVLFEMPNFGIRALALASNGLLAGVSLGARYTAFAVERLDGSSVNRAALEGDMTVDLRVGATSLLSLSVTDVAYDRRLEPGEFRSDGLLPGSRAILESSVRIERGLRLVGAGFYSWEFEQTGGAAALAWCEGVTEIVVGGRWTPEADRHRLVPLVYLTVLLGGSRGGGGEP
jgi:hypothetical protein